MNPLPFARSFLIFSFPFARSFLMHAFHFTRSLSDDEAYLLPRFGKFFLPLLPGFLRHPAYVRPPSPEHAAHFCMSVYKPWSSFVEYEPLSSDILLPMTILCIIFLSRIICSSGARFYTWSETDYDDVFSQSLSSAINVSTKKISEA